MTATLTPKGRTEKAPAPDDEKTIIVNQFKGGSRVGDKTFHFDHCILGDPRDIPKLPPDWTGFEVVTARDGGKMVSWSRLNFEQIAEAKKRFEELIAEGLVPYYLDPKTNLPTEIMTEFDPAAAAAVFEKPEFDPKRLTLAPTRMAVGG